MTLPPTNARMAPTAVITTAGALAAYDRAVVIGSPEAYQQAADMLADLVRRGGHRGKLAASAAERLEVSAPKRKATPREPVQAGIFNAQNLYAALERISRAMDLRSVIPILTFIRLRVEGGKAMISGTDLDMEVLEVLSDADMPDCDICLPAKALLDALKGTRGGIKLEVGEIKTVMDVGGVKHVMSQHGSGDMPSLPAQEVLASFSMPVEALRDKLAFVATGMSQEETRYYLNGMFMHLYTEAGTDMLTVVSTDGHRLFSDRTPAPAIQGDSEAARQGVIIPRKAVAWMLRNLPKTGDVMVVLSKAKGAEGSAGRAFAIHAGETVMITKVIDGSFPDYHRVIPQPGKMATVGLIEISDTGAAAEVILRVAKVSNEKSRAGLFSLSETGVNLTVKNMEGGRADADLPACAAGGDVEVGFNIAYVLDAIGKAPMVNILISAPQDPARVEYPGFPGRVAVLMPLRV
jgi:DNA polymerase III subunit beta